MVALRAHFQHQKLMMRSEQGTPSQDRHDANMPHERNVAGAEPQPSDVHVCIRPDHLQCALRNVRASLKDFVVTHPGSNSQ
jgi:hypothetical protein